MIRRFVLASALALLPGLAFAADARQTILAELGTQARQADAAFAGFSADRGQSFYRTAFAGGDTRTPACASCHGADPAQPGRNAKTGRPIDPIAVSANPKRFTDPDQVDKHFARDCKSVLGRDCTAVEKGDYITFLTGK